MFFAEPQPMASRRERREHVQDMKFADRLVRAAKNLGPLAVHDIEQGVRFAMSPDTAYISHGVYNELENDEERILFNRSLAKARTIGPDRYARVSDRYKGIMTKIENEELASEPKTAE